MDPSAEFLTHSSPTPPPPAAASSDSSTSIDSSATATAGADGSTAAAPVAGLDADIANVMAGLGSFWGKMKKQTTATLASAEKQLDSARKDLTPLVSKARANLDSLGEQTRAELARLSEVQAGGGAGGGGGVIIGADGMPIIMDDVPVKKERVVDNGKGKGVDRGPEGETAAAEGAPSAEGAEETNTKDAQQEPTPAEQAAAFFSKFQHQLAANPEIHKLTNNLTTLQASVQSGLASQSGALQKNIAQLQDQLSHLDLIEQQKKAAGLITRGEGWIAELSHEVQRIAKDVVQVVPPSEAALSEERGRKRDERQRKAEQVAVGRRDQLLFKLRTDPSLISVDPAQPPKEAFQTDVRELFATFLGKIEDRGGLEGEQWAKEVEQELLAAGEGLKKTLEALVPASLTKEAFWSRYFFRAGQIDEDERKRKQVLEGSATAAEDDFSWDAEDESENEQDEPASPPAMRESLTPKPIEVIETGTSEKSSPVLVDSAKGASPRVSSDGASSYDVVGRASGAPSEGDAEAEAGAVKEEKEKVQAVEEKAQTKEPMKEESEEDSDWE